MMEVILWFLLLVIPMIIHFIYYVCFIVLVWRYKYVNKAKEERTMDLPVN